MSDQQIIITVSGIDKVGIVAKVSAVLAEYEARTFCNVYAMQY